MVVYTYMGMCGFLGAGIVGIVTKELSLILFGFGLFLILLPYIMKECGIDIFIEGEKNNILYGIFYVLGGLLIISGIICGIFGIGFSNSNSNSIENECLLNYSDYNVNLCKDNFNGIKICERINATFIKVEGHLFSSSNYICEKGGEIIRI